MLIGVSGKAHAGKDEVGKIFVERYNCRRFALATKMKEAALALDPIVDFAPIGPAPTKPSQVQAWHPIRLSELIADVGPAKAKDHPEVRRLYQRMGTEVGRRTLDEDLWVKLLFQLAGRYKNVVVTDVRFINELVAIQKRGGFVLRIVRPDNEGLSGQTGKHVSENELTDDLSLYDAYIHNDGTLEELVEKTAKALASIGV